MLLCCFVALIFIIDLLSDLDGKYSEPSVDDLPTRSTSPTLSTPASNSDRETDDSWSGFGSSMSPKDENEGDHDIESEAEVGPVEASDVKSARLFTMSEYPILIGVAHKYVPPQLRKAPEASQSEQDAKLKRLLKGHLNRQVSSQISTSLISNRCLKVDGAEY